MNNPLFLFVGKSASGKTTAAEILESKYNLKTLQSYTTRPKRYENETGHTFISDEEFGNLKNIIAYNEYNGYKYCATKDQIDKTSIYVIDVPGVKTLLQNYNSDRKIIVFYFDASIRTRIDRMVDRHDSDMAIVSRIYNDEASDWYEELDEAIWNYNKLHDDLKPVELYSINANNNLDNVLGQIEFIIDMGWTEREEVN